MTSRPSMKLSRTSSSGPSSCCTSATQSAQTPFDSHFSKASDSFRLSPPDESSFIPVADRSASLAHPSSPSQTGLSATPSTSAASAEQRWKRPEVWFWSERHVALLQREGRGEGGAAADSSAVQQEGDAFGCGSWLRSSVDCMRSFNVFRLLPPQSQSLHKLFLHKAVTGLSRTLAFLQKAQRSALLSLPTNGAAAKLDLMQTFVARLSGGLLKAERHSVYTADGFLLCLYSLRRARRTCCLAAGCRCLEVDGLEGGEGFTAKEDLLDATRTPVFYFQHGLLESSLNWVSGGWRSLPFMLAAAGAEVWVGNNRGNEFARPCVQRGKGAAGFDLASLERFVQSRLLLLTEKSPAESETETEREQGSGGSGVLGRSRQSLEGEGLCSNFCCRCSRLTSFPDVRGASLERQLAVLRGACWEALSLLLRLRGVPCFSSFPNQGRGSSSAGLEGDSRCTGEAPLTDETSLPPFREHLQQTCAGHWSFHEMAVLDLPAQLQFVAENSPSLNANGKSRVGSCVGHSSSARPSSVFGSGVVCVGQSQGAAQILACLSLAPSLSGLIRQAVVFSPPLILQPLRRLPRGAVLLLRVGLKSPVFLLRLLRGVALALPSFALGSLGDAVAGHGHGLGMRFYTTPLQREQREINFRHTPSGKERQSHSPSLCVCEWTSVRDGADSVRRDVCAGLQGGRRCETSLTGSTSSMKEGLFLRCLLSKKKRMIHLLCRRKIRV